MYDHLTQQQHSQKNSHVNKTSTQKKTALVDMRLNLNRIDRTITSTKSGYNIIY